MAPGLLYEDPPSATSFDSRPSIMPRSYPVTYPVSDPRHNSSTDLCQSVSGHIWIVTGPAGCGKSTVAKSIADELRVPYIEGDEFHPEANIKKMSAGVPLADADRWGWLTTLRKEGLSQLQRRPSTTAARQNGSRSSPRTRPAEPMVVMTCSALKRKYRDILRGNSVASDVRSAYPTALSRAYAPRPDQPNVHVHFLYLRAPEEVLLARVVSRKGHYMKENMVRSQFASLEEPTPEEPDVVALDVGTGHGQTEVKRSAVEIVRRSWSA